MNDPIGQLITIETSHKHHANPEKDKSEIKFNIAPRRLLPSYNQDTLVWSITLVDGKIEISFNSVISFIWLNCNSTYLE